jgi:hypothetical protein
MPDIDPALAENSAHFPTEHVFGDMNFAVEQKNTLLPIIDHVGSGARHSLASK